MTTYHVCMSIESADHMADDAAQDMFNATAAEVRESLARRKAICMDGYPLCRLWQPRLLRLRPRVPRLQAERVMQAEEQNAALGELLECTIDSNHGDIDSAEREEAARAALASVKGGAA